MNETKCESCGATVVWVTTKAGRPMICEARVLTIYTDAGEQVRGREPHWAYCPNAEKHRRKTP